MSTLKNEAIRLVGEPARFARKRLTGYRPIWWACWAIFWILVLWDIYLSIDAVCGNTWSEVMREASLRKPVLPWLLGAFLTHLFHFKDDLQPVIDRDAAITVMVILTLGLGALGITGIELAGWCMSLTVVLGMAAGLLLWPKHRLGAWYW